MNSLPRVPTKKVVAEKCKRSFYFFFQEFWPVIEQETLINNWHIEYLCNELQEVAQRVFDRQPKAYDLIINIPPGSTKSTIATVMFPAWCWARDPEIRTISSSYSHSLSIDHGVKSRDLITSDDYKEYFDVRLRDDQAAKSRYKNTKGGERIVTSIGGSVTGQHGHFIILDDPINPNEAASDAKRKSANDYIDTTINTRKVDKEVSVTILIMQRLHQDDPTGHMLAKGGKVKHICLPGELSKEVAPKELKDNYTDGLLDPQRLSESILTELKMDLGSYGYAGQIQQSPSPMGGGIWQKWFIPVEDNKMDNIVPSLVKYGTDWDTAYTKKQGNSASAYVTAGSKDKDVYIDWIGFAFKEFPELIKYMAQQAAPHYIEKRASGKSAKQTLTNEGINAIEVDVSGGDKIARARMATPTAEAGRVFVRKSQVNMLYYDEKQGILKFPNASHDDLADAVSQSIQRLSKPQLGFV